jgi:hypothetical protein
MLFFLRSLKKVFLICFICKKTKPFYSHHEATLFFSPTTVSPPFWLGAKPFSGKPIPIKPFWLKPSEIPLILIINLTLT